MRILIVTQYFWPETFRVNDLATALACEKGHSVTVLTGIPNYPGGRFFDGYGLWTRLREEYCGMRVIRVPMLPRGRDSKIMLVLNYLSFAISASLLGPILCRSRYDVIFVAQYSPVTVGLPALVMKKITQAPIFFWVQDLWPESLSATGAIKSPLLLRWVGKLVDYIYDHCDRILVQSKTFTAKIMESCDPSKQIGYLPNWAEDFYIPITSAGSKVDDIKLPQGFRVMFAGNIGAAQDFGTILAAAEKLKPFTTIKWCILGNGRMREWVEKEIQLRELSETVFLLGSFPAERMPAFFALADTMLVTLKNDPIFAMTIPGKVQSYLACGKPIVASIDGEGRRLVEESGAGLACPAEDSAGLANLVLEMYRKSSEEREQMGKNGIQYYQKNFDRRMLIDRLDLWLKGGQIS